MLQSRKQYYIDPPELVSSPGKFTNTTGWIAGSNSSISTNSGSIRITTTANGLASAYATITCVPEIWYLIECHIPIRVLTGLTSIGVGTSAGDTSILNQSNGLTGGGKSALFKATQTIHYVSLTTSAAGFAGEYVHFDLYSVKEYV